MCSWLRPKSKLLCSIHMLSALLALNVHQLHIKHQRGIARDGS